MKVIRFSCRFFFANVDTTRNVYFDKTGKICKHQLRGCSWTSVRAISGRCWGPMEWSLWNTVKSEAFERGFSSSTFCEVNEAWPETRPVLHTRERAKERHVGTQCWLKPDGTHSRISHPHVNRKRAFHGSNDKHASSQSRPLSVWRVHVNHWHKEDNPY